LEAEYESKENGDRQAVPVTSEKVSVKDAVMRFLKSKRNENLADSTIDKLKTIFEKQFLSWATESRLKHLEDITTADLEAFRDTWEDGALAKKKKQERLIGFFYYSLRLGWIKSNPAVSLGRIRADGPPTDYFPKHEFDHIIDATYIYQPKGWVECRNQATRLRILTLLMRWSGLAIRDAVTLERRRLNDKDELFLYRAKTGNPVYVPLPPDVADFLRRIPAGPCPNPRYFFWSGNGSPKSVVGNWQRSFRRLFKISDLRREDGTPKRCHPHMFRDTFAVEMLLAGVPLEQVSILLGHKSVKITEKHYAPWVKARQELLAANVRKAWTVLQSGGKKSRRKQPQRVKTA
jgi:integrase